MTFTKIPRPTRVRPAVRAAERALVRLPIAVAGTEAGGGVDALLIICATAERTGRATREGGTADRLVGRTAGLSARRVARWELLESAWADAGVVTALAGVAALAATADLTGCTARRPAARLPACAARLIATARLSPTAANASAAVGAIDAACALALAAMRAWWAASTVAARFTLRAARAAAGRRSGPNPFDVLVVYGQLVLVLALALERVRKRVGGREGREH
jgi:hypothetical protein